MADKLTPEKIAELRARPTKPYEERTQPNEIPRWVKMAVTRMVILAETQAEAAAHFNRKGRTLGNWCKAPFVKEWIKQLDTWSDDPVRVAEALIRGSVLEAALDQIWAIETAKEKGDYKEVRIGTRDILATHDVLRPSQQARIGQGPIMIQIQLPGAELEVPTVQTSYEVIAPEAEYELLPEDTND